MQLWRLKTLSLIIKVSMVRKWEKIVIDNGCGRLSISECILTNKSDFYRASHRKVCFMILNNNYFKCWRGDLFKGQMKCKIPIDIVDHLVADNYKVLFLKDASWYSFDDMELESRMTLKHLVISIVSTAYSQLYYKAPLEQPQYLWVILPVRGPTSIWAKFCYALFHEQQSSSCGYLVKKAPW